MVPPFVSFEKLVKNLQDQVQHFACSHRNCICINIFFIYLYQLMYIHIDNIVCWHFQHKIQKAEIWILGLHERASLMIKREREKTRSQEQTPSTRKFIHQATLTPFHDLSLHMYLLVWKEKLHEGDLHKCQIKILSPLVYTLANSL